MHRPPFAAVAFLPAFAMAAAGAVPNETVPNEAIPTEHAACTLSAWSTGTAAAGLDVHAGAASDTPVIARLPTPIQGAGDAYATEVSITAAQDGWFRIDVATLDDYASDAGPAVVFEGQGWVSGRFLGLGLNDTRLYRAPSAEAPVVARLAGMDQSGLAVGADGFVVERLLDCQGSWVEVEGTFLGKPLRGWATGTCANQVTTCP